MKYRNIGKNFPLSHYLYYLHLAWKYIKCVRKEHDEIIFVNFITFMPLGS